MKWREGLTDEWLEKKNRKTEKREERGKEEWNKETVYIHACTIEGWRKRRGEQGYAVAIRNAW